MNELKLVLNTKNVRKVACAAGIGWAVGNFIGRTINTAYSGIIIAISKTAKSSKKDERETTE